MSVSGVLAGRWRRGQGVWGWLWAGESVAGAAPTWNGL